MADDKQRVKELFGRASELPPDERPAFLERACGDDAGVRHAVDALLAALDEAGEREFFGSPTAGATVAEGPGSILGPYKLLQQIGEGGFGVVYMAEQTEPVRRKVALKIIRLGMDTKQVVARFEAERQALALMDHPNIAKVLDAGTTETGRPYFVMELVKGVPITEYCDQRKLDTRARLALFRPVCHAVQHAHLKGVIHRDLKPSNVLVTLHDGEPVPKVIDFGIAKAVDRPLTEKTLFTEFRQMIGTPDYMAPEQAELSGLDVDTRADIYSLGVLLYELLTGTRPFDLKSLMEKGYDEILRTIREVDPPLPSTRASTADRAGPDGRVPLARLLRGDLDWIVMKALDKDRSRRYETANALAADVGRYLADEAVRASPPGAAYRARKYLRRNRVAVAAAAVVLAALLVSGGLALAASREARIRTEDARAAALRATEKRTAAEDARAREDEQRERARAGAAKAENESKRAAAVLGVIRKVLGEGKPKDYTVRALLEDFEREIAGTLRSQPEVEAWIRTAMVDPLLGIGLYDRAEVQARAALEIRREILGADHLDYAESLTVLGAVLVSKADYEEASALFREALAVCRDRRDGDARMAVALLGLAAVIETDHDEALGLAREAVAIQRKILRPDHPHLATTLNNLAATLMDLERWDEAEAHVREALAIHKKAVGTTDHPGRAVYLHNLGQVHHHLDDHAEALKLAREALALRRKWQDANHPNLAANLVFAGRVSRILGELPEAEQHLVEGLAISRETFGDDHPTTGNCHAELGNLYQDARKLDAAARHHRASLAILRSSGNPTSLGTALTNLGCTLELAGEIEEAERLFREAIEVAREAPPGVRAKAVNGLGVLLQRWGRHGESEELFLEAIAIWRTMRPPRYPPLAGSLGNLATALHSRGEYTEAIERAREAVAIARLSPCTPLDLSYALNILGLALEDLGELDEAEKVHREAISIRRARHGPKSRELLATSLNNLALVLGQKGDPAGAEKLSREALDIRRKALPPGHPDLAQGLHNLACQLHARGEHAEARMMFQQALEIRRRVFGDGHTEVANTLQGLAQVHRSLGERDEAMELFRRVLAIRKRAHGGEDHPDVGASYESIGTLLLAMGQVDEAETSIERACDILERILGERHPKYASAIHKLGHVAERRKRWDRAEELFRRALAIRRAANASIAEDRRCMGQLANLVHDEAHSADQRGAPAEAERLHRRALAMRREVELDPAREIDCLVRFLGKTESTGLQPFLGDLLARERTHPLLARLGATLLAQGKYAEAEGLLRECLALRVKEVPDSWFRYNAMSMLGAALAGQGKHAEAEPLLIEGFEKMAPPARSASRKRQALERVVELYEAWGKPNKAAEWRARQ